VLAGRTELKGVRGHLLVDGRDQPHNYKCMTGYVVQVCRYHTIYYTRRNCLWTTKCYSVVVEEMLLLSEWFIFLLTVGLLDCLHGLLPGPSKVFVCSFS